MKKQENKEGMEMITFENGTEAHPYELSAISTNLSDTEMVGFIERVKKIITDATAEIKSESVPLRARLAYPIRKSAQGVYYYIRFAALPSKIRDIMHDLNLMPEMLRPHIDALRSFADKKIVMAPITTIGDTKTFATAPRGWTKREDSPTPLGTIAVSEEITVPIINEIVPEDIPPMVPAQPPKPVEEPTITMKDLDKRLEEILGKNI